ncbi:MAG: hypothetical protein P4L84_11000 [Isosphaeraceae bacterium]|nr:hypothetical protein [Isosphaeraceae bacterium]
MMRWTLKRAIDTVVTITLLVGALALLTAGMRLVPEPTPPMTLRHRSDWWHSLLKAIPSE